MKHSLPTGISLFGRQAGETYLLNKIGFSNLNIAISLSRVFG